MATAVGEEGGGVETYQQDVNNEATPSSQIASPGTDCMSSGLANPFYQGNVMTHHIYQPQPMLATQIAPMYLPPPDYPGNSQVPYHAAGFAPPPIPYDTIYRNTASMYPPTIGDNVTTAMTAMPDTTKSQSFNHWGTQNHNQTQMPPTSYSGQANGLESNPTSSTQQYTMNKNGNNEKTQQENAAQATKEAPKPLKEHQPKPSVSSSVEQNNQNGSTSNKSASRDLEKPSQETLQADTTLNEESRRSDRDRKPSEKMVQAMSLEEDVAATVRRFMSASTTPAPRPKSADDVEVSPDSYVFLDLDKKFYCKKCAYGSPRLDKIEQHIRAHISGKFGCDICGRAFIKKCDQQRHAIAHAHARIRPKGLEAAVKPLYTDTTQTNSRPSSASSSTSITPSPFPSPNNHQVPTNHTVSSVASTTTPHQKTGKSGAKGNKATAKVPLGPTMSAINTHNPVTRNSHHPTTNTASQPYLPSVWPVKSEVLPQSSQNNYSYLKMLLGDGDLEAHMFGLTGPHGLSASQGGHHLDMIETNRSHRGSSSEIKRILNTVADKKGDVAPTVDEGVPKSKSAKQPQARFHPYDTGSFDASNYGGSSMWNTNVPNYPATYIPDTGSGQHQYGGNMPGYPGQTAYGNFQGVQVFSQFPDQKPMVSKLAYESPEPLIITPRPMDIDTVVQPSVDYGRQESNPDMWASHRMVETHDEVMPMIVPGKEIVIAPVDSQETGASSHGNMAETGLTANILKERIRTVANNQAKSQDGTDSNVQAEPILIDVSSAHYIAGRVPPPSTLESELSIDIPNPSARVNTSASSNSRNLCCSICNYSTKDPWQLEKHLLAHTKGSRTCKYCNKAFERSSDLARHEELHWKNSKEAGDRTFCAQVSPQSALPSPSSLTGKPSPKQSGPKPVEFYPCDMCRGKFISKENLALHKTNDHNTFCARFEEFEGNVLVRSSVLKCEVSAQNEITLFDGATDLSDLSIQAIPTISLPAHIPEILDRPKTQQTEAEKEAMMKKGEDIWVRDQNKIIAYQQLEKKRKEQSQAIYPGGQHPKRARSGEAIYRCTTCNYVTSVHSNWEEHQRAHQGRFVCEICGKAFLKSSDLSRHWMRHKTTPGAYAFSCASCPYETSDKRAIEQHMKQHGARKQGMVPNDADPYPKRTGSAAYVPPIVQQVTSPERPGQCRVCGMSFARPSQLKRHEQTHVLNNYNPMGGPDIVNLDTFKPVNYPTHGKAAPVVVAIEKTFYECKYCGQDFQSQGALDIHEREHSSACPQPVPQAVPQVPPTGTNQNVPAGLACQYCDKVFKHPKNLDNHMMFHFGLSDAPANSPAECHICGKIFTSGNYLKDHLRLHTGETPYNCEKCGRRFSSTRNLSKHSIICKGPE